VRQAAGGPLLAQSIVCALQQGGEDQHVYKLREGSILGFVRRIVLPSTQKGGGG